MQSPHGGPLNPGGKPVGWHPPLREGDSARGETSNDDKSNDMISLLSDPCRVTSDTEYTDIIRRMSGADFYGVTGLYAAGNTADYNFTR
jgi:hypothetical protein